MESRSPFNFAPFFHNEHRGERKLICFPDNAALRSLVENSRERILFSALRVTTQAPGSKHSRKQTPPHTRASGQVCARIRNIDRVYSCRYSPVSFVPRPFIRVPIALRPLLLLLLRPQPSLDCRGPRSPRKFCGNVSCRFLQRLQLPSAVCRERNLRALIRPLRLSRHGNRFSRITLVLHRDSRGLCPRRTLTKRSL